MKRSTVHAVIVMRRPGVPAQGLLRAGHVVARCALGRGGVVTHKREGDGGSPRGRFHLRRLWWRADRMLRPHCGLPMQRTRPSDGWCDAPAHGRYNRAVALPFTASHEEMWRADHLYDAVIEIGWNDQPARRGRGSAIFLHLARPGFAPTEGCVAVSRATMLRLLPLIGRQTRIEIS
jgi:L,D-peptidoglycan transpeptidase YkuD (ErfK/YbiS/YcfS/YnhG family)